jgi:hypothetical protein
MLPGHLRSVQYCSIPPGALTLFRIVEGIRVVQHLAPCVGYTSAQVPPGALGFPKIQLLQEAVDSMVPPSAISDMTRMDFESEVGCPQVVVTVTGSDTSRSAVSSGHPTQASRGSAPRLERTSGTTLEPKGDMSMSGID